MTKPTIIAFALILAVAGAVTAHGGKVSGMITDVVSGKPVPFATVLIEGTSLACVADSTGRFEIRHVPPGKQTLIISAVGHESHKCVVHTPMVTDSPLEIQLQLLHRRDRYTDTKIRERRADFHRGCVQGFHRGQVSTQYL